MATLTRDQAINWNKMLFNGYRFDVRHFVIWNEKTASLKVELSEDKILEASLSYREERQGFRSTGRQKPVLHLALWNVNRETGVGTSSGLGVFLDVGEVQEKKNWKYLCQLSGEYTADKIMELARQHADQLGNPYLFTKTA